MDQVVMAVSGLENHRRASGTVARQRLAAALNQSTHSCGQCMASGGVR